MIQQFSEGVTAVVDVYIYILESYPWYHSVPKRFICCCSGRDSCMLPSRCMLPSLRSAPSSKLTPLNAPVSSEGSIFQAYPSLCPCEPGHLLGDTQAVSCGARSRQYSRLLPPARNLDVVSSREQVQGPWVGVIYIDYSRSSDAPRSPSRSSPANRRAVV